MTDPDRTPHRPPVDFISLVAGIVAATLWAAFAFGDLDTLSEVGRVVWPTVLIGAGVALLLESRRR